MKHLGVYEHLEELGSIGKIARIGAGGLTMRKHQAPEIQTMYTLNMPVSAIRTKMRQEFERHRYVSKLKTVDVLIYNSHAEFQVRILGEYGDTMAENEGLTQDRKHSTSGSRCHTSLSTSAQRRTRRRDYRRPSLMVSSRYV